MNLSLAWYNWVFITRPDSRLRKDRRSGQALHSLKHRSFLDANYFYSQSHFIFFASGMVSNASVRAEILTEVINAAAVPKRAEDYFRRLQTSDAAQRLNKAPTSQLKLLAALFSGSMALSDLLVVNPEWLPAL